MELSAKQLSQILSGTIEGDENVKVTRLAKIENGKSGDLCFFANPKYEQYVYSSKASVMLVNKDFQPRGEIVPTLIRVDNAYEAIATLLNYSAQMKRRAKARKSLRAKWFLSTKFGRKVSVGAFSYVGRHTVVGDGTVIHEQVYVGDGCTIGKNCILYPGVRIYPGMVIGNNVIIHSNAVVGSDGFGNVPKPDGTWEKIEHLGKVIIGDNVEIGACTTIDRSEMEATVIGSGVKIDNLCQIAHNVQLGDNTVMAAQVGIAGSAQIGKNCILAGQVGIAGHIKMADHTTIGAQGGVIGNIRKEGQVLLGSPVIDAKQYMKAYALFKQAAEE